MNSTILPSDYFEEDSNISTVNDELVDDNNFLFTSRVASDIKEDEEVEPVSDVVDPNSEATTKNQPISNIANNSSNTANNTYTNDNSTLKKEEINQFTTNNNNNTSNNFNNTYKEELNNEYTDLNQYNRELNDNSVKNNNTEPNVQNSNYQNVINNQILDIDSSIKDLQKKLSDLNKSKKDTFFKVVDNEGINNFEEDNKVEIFNSEESNTDKITINNTINNLKNQKNKLISLLNRFVNQDSNVNSIDTNNNTFNRDNTSSNVKNDETIINNSSIEKSEFVPNLSTSGLDNNNALDLAVKTEKFFGEEPKIVSDNGQPVVISKSQGTLEKAIEEHGGAKKAVQDSIKNQNYVSSLAKTDNNTFSTIEESNNNVVVPDKNDTINNNTSKIIEMLGVITNTLKDVAVKLGSKKEIGNSEQKSIKTNNTTNNNQFKTNNSNFSQSNNNQANLGQNESTSTNTDGGKSKPSLPKGIRGDYPLSTDFPPNFDLTSLGGSNLQ